MGEGQRLLGEPPDSSAERPRPEQGHRLPAGSGAHVRRGAGGRHLRGLRPAGPVGGGSVLLCWREWAQFGAEDSFATAVAAAAEATSAPSAGAPVQGIAEAAQNGNLMMALKLALEAQQLGGGKKPTAE